MKIKSIFITIIFLSIAPQLFAQFTPIEFTDYEPAWIYYFYDSTAVDFYSNTPVNDGRSHLVYDPRIIMEGDTVCYVLYKIRVENFKADGGFIQKINIKKRKVLWSVFFDLRNNDKFENPSHFRKNEDGNLEIIGFRSLDTEFFSGKSRFFRRVYDPDDGSLLEHYYAPETDTLAPYLYAGLDWGESQLFPKGDSIIYVSRVSYDTMAQTHNYVYHLNHFGQIFDYFLLPGEYIYKYPLMNQQFYKVTEGQYINYQTCKNSLNSYVDTFKHRDFLQYYDEEFRKDRQYEITEHFRIKDNAAYYLYFVDEDYVNLTFWEQWEPLHWRTIFYFFNHSGELVDSSIMISPENYYINYLETQRISEDEFLYAGSTRWQDKGVNNTFHIYKRKMGGELEYLKVLEIKQPNHLIITEQIIPLKNGDLLFFGRHSSTQFNAQGEYQDHWGENWNFMMYLPAEDFGLSTEHGPIKNEQRIQMLLSPNPVSNNLNIRFDIALGGKLEIFDFLGKRISSFSLSVSDLHTIDVRDLKAGSYFVRFTDKSTNSYSVGSFVKF